MMNYQDFVQESQSEFWPDELWQLLKTLVEQMNQPNRSRQPQIAITSRNCPNYIAPSSDRSEFHDALRFLERLKIVEVKWQANASNFAQKIRLLDQQQEFLKQLIETHFPSQYEQERNLIDWNLVYQATQKYGQLGLRTVAHISYGNAHKLDNAILPNDLNVWIQPDVITKGGSLLRVAGNLLLITPYSSFTSCWQLPGHYLWEWELKNAQIQTIGQRLFLIENPYAMWELMLRWQQKDITFVCIHGYANVSHKSILATFLGLVYQLRPNLETLIWCDPDPQGLGIATHIHKLVKDLNGQPQFWLMDNNILEILENIILPSNKLLPINQDDQLMLNTFVFDSHLQPLANMIQKHGYKGEQEGLVVLLQ